jgi:hypothetical protein
LPFPGPLSGVSLSGVSLSGGPFSVFLSSNIHINGNTFTSLIKITKDYRSVVTKVTVFLKWWRAAPLAAPLGPFLLALLLFALAQPGLRVVLGIFQNSP